MADSTIAALTAASALGGTELFYADQGGADRKVTATQIKTWAQVGALLAANNLSDLANAGTARTNLGLGTLATLSAVALASNVSGTLPVANGGTGQTSIAAATAALNAMVGDSGSGGTKGLVPAPASGDAAAGKYLKADGTWAAPSGGSGFTGTYGSGTITADAPITFSQTWNNAAVAFTGFSVDITSTASAAGSTPFRVRLGGTNVIYYNPGAGDGARLELANNGAQIGSFGGATGICGGGWSDNNFNWFILSTNGQVRMPSTKVMGWVNDTSAYSSLDTALARNAAGVAEVNSGTAGTLRDLKLRSVIQSPPASVAPASNGEMVVEATSNTSLTLKLKGSDGTVRSAVLVLT